MNATAVSKSGVISGYTTGTNRWDIQLDRLAATARSASLNTSRAAYTASTTTIAPGTLYHIAVTHDKPTDTVSVYVDGQLEKTGTLGMTFRRASTCNWVWAMGLITARWTTWPSGNDQLLSAGQIMGIYEKKAVATQDGDWATAATWFGQPGG